MNEFLVRFLVFGIRNEHFSHFWRGNSLKRSRNELSLTGIQKFVETTTFNSSCNEKHHLFFKRLKTSLSSRTCPQRPACIISVDKKNKNKNKNERLKSFCQRRKSKRNNFTLRWDLKCSPTRLIPLAHVQLRTLTYVNFNHVNKIEAR